MRMRAGGRPKLAVVVVVVGALLVAGSIAWWAANAPGSDVVDVDDLPSRQADRPRPIVLHEIRGSYRGSTIGDRRSEAKRRHGPSQRPARSDDTGPIGSDEDGTPGSWNPPGSAAGYPRDLDYRGSSYLVEQRREDPRVYGIIVTDRRAQTSRGVGIGDTLAFAVRRYPQLRCDVVGRSRSTSGRRSRRAVRVSLRVAISPSERTPYARSPS